MKRPRLALLAGPLLALLVAPTVLAITPPGTVTVETNGCSFVIHVDLDQRADVVGWTVNASTDPGDWNDGTTVHHGSTSTDADGKVDIGPLTADAGEYNVVVDDETPVDSSSIVEHFTLTCESGTAPTPTPTGEELPATGTPTPKPAGEEEAATGHGGAVGGISATPPPTNTGVATSSPSGGPSWLVVAMIGAASIGTFVMSTRRFGTVRARARTRRTRS